MPFFRVLLVDGHPEQEPSIFNFKMPFSSSKSINLTSPPSSWTKGRILLTSSSFIYLTTGESFSLIPASLRPLYTIFFTFYRLSKVHQIHSDLEWGQKSKVLHRSNWLLLIWQLIWSPYHKKPSLLLWLWIVFEQEATIYRRLRQWEYRQALRLPWLVYWLEWIWGSEGWECFGFLRRVRRIFWWWDA